MKKKFNNVCLVDIVSIVITVSIVLFMAAVILSIIIGGVPHLKEALASEEIRFAIGLSLYTSTISTLICVALAIPCGYTLSRKKLPYTSIMQGIVELPLSLPYLVLGMALLILFSTPVGKALRDMGFPVVFDTNGIIIAQLTVNLPFSIRIIRTEMAKIDPRVDFLAGTLGASKNQRFWTITLPACRIGILLAGVLVWARALGEFGATLMLVGVTRMKTETLPGSIFLNVSTGETGKAMAAAMIMLMFSAVALGVTSMCNNKLKLRSRMKEFM